MQRPRKGPEIEDDFFETETAQSPYPPIVITDLPTDIVLPRLVCVRGTPPSWTARCPAHADHDPSLSLAETEDKRLLIHCHAGCTAEQVMAAIGLDLQQLFPAPYAIRHGRRHKNPLSQPLSELPDIRALASVTTPDRGKDDRLSEVRPAFSGISMPDSTGP